MVGCFQSKLCLICHWADPEPAPKPSPSIPARRRRRRRGGGKKRAFETWKCNFSPYQLHSTMNQDVEGQCIKRLSVTFACFCHCFNSSSCAELSLTPAKKRNIQTPKRKHLSKKQLKRGAVTGDLAWMSFNVPVAHAGGWPHGCWRTKTEFYVTYKE